jgi:hypothetical protein
VFPKLKVGNKTSFGAARSFLPLKFLNSELHSLLIFGVLSPLLTLLLVMVIVVPVVVAVQE